MKKYIKEYIKIIENKLDKKISHDDIIELKDKINFFSHERLIHLLVTLFCLLVLIIFIILSFNYTIFIIPAIILIILNIFYIVHYYFLENSIQYLYKLYDKMNDKLK